MPEELPLNVKVSYDDSSVTAGAARAAEVVSSLGATIQSALGAASIGAVEGLGAAFAGSVKSAAGFELQVSVIKAVQQMTKRQKKRLSKKALQLGKDTSFSASEAAAGMEEMVKAGVTLKSVMSGAGRAALDLAEMGDARNI